MKNKNQEKTKKGYEESEIALMCVCMPRHMCEYKRCIPSVPIYIT